MIQYTCSFEIDTGKFKTCWVRGCRQFEGIAIMAKNLETQREATVTGF